jgi:hypothetical protein
MISCYRARPTFGPTQATLITSTIAVDVRAREQPELRAAACER